MTLEERHTLTPGARSWLRTLDAAPLAWRAARPTPLNGDLQSLIHSGLAFRSALSISITDAGRATLERVS